MSESRNIFYPQTEITTVLVPVTRGCSFNQCAFCSMYKEETYEEVTLQEIEFELMNGETYTERVFLTGADPLSVGYEKMMRYFKTDSKVLSVLWMCGYVCSCPNNKQLYCGRIETASCGRA